MAFTGKTDSNLTDSLSNTTSNSNSSHVSGLSAQDLEIKRWLRGKWVRREIDQFEYDYYYYIYTFSDRGYRIDWGTERNMSSSNEICPYEVKGNVIYTSLGEPLFKIDKQRNQLIEYKNSNHVYERE